ncbi:ATP-binding protein [Motiliproteus sp. MSK22-1]|uniref:ATP-binding protein n=1 Tax=Motiliproteus sp. MSK22-1 TaxID=1897630 RepID=UPI000976CC5D|nr:ATP-binding protein [Motiliproteus sp. MSK22-1]OMH28389.1 hypothetical protein BGP75_21045 [Motiliproteus sp. MSK22-1]
MADTDTDIPLKKRIAYRQARFVVICALGLGLLFSSIQIYVDYLQQKEDLSRTSLQTLSIMKQTAAEAAFHLDPNLANEVAAGMFEYEPFVFVQIDGYLGSDQFSEPLIAKQRTIQKPHYEWLSRSLFGTLREHKIKLTKTDLIQPDVGILTVHVDPYPIGISFVNRSLAALLFGVLRAVVLALIVFAFFYLHITKPLNLLSNAWLKVKPESPSPDELPDAGIHKNDEIGLIITRARDFLSAHRHSLDRRQAMEQQLIQAKEELEERVKRRTIDLETEIREKEVIQKDLVRAKLLAEQATHAKSVFLATMSHEIRTPLHGVQGMLQVLAQDPDLSPKQRETLSIIDDSAKLLTEIINDVLDLSKIEAGQLELQQEPISISQLIKSSLALMQSRAEEKNLSLEEHISEDVPQFILGDATRIQQIILNIVGNAIKFTSTGKVSIAVSVDGIDNSLVNIRIEIRDTGIGLSERQQKEIFEPFVQVESITTSNIGGTGLGLSICTKLLRLMHGEIGVESSPGKGSLFWLRIPFPVIECNPEAGTELMPASAPAPQKLTPLRILLAEDNDVNRKIAQELLSADGHQVEPVDNGQKALEKIAAYTYDVVLMDNHMPKMSGLEVMEAIRTLQPPKCNTPIIMLSADAITQTRERSLETGAIAFLSKPFKHEQLRLALSKATQRHSDVFLKKPVRDRTISRKSPTFDTWINTEKLNELRISIGDALLEEVLVDIKSQIHSAIEQLPLLNANQQGPELRMVSHSLLGAARELNFSKISKLCKGIEMASIEQLFDQADPLIQLLVSSQKMIDTEIDRYRLQHLGQHTDNRPKRDENESANC